MIVWLGSPPEPPGGRREQRHEHGQGATSAAHRVTQSPDGARAHRWPLAWVHVPRRRACRSRQHAEVAPWCLHRDSPSPGSRLVSGPIAARVFVRREISPRRIGLPFHAAGREGARSMWTVDIAWRQLLNILPLAAIGPGHRRPLVPTGRPPLGPHRAHGARTERGGRGGVITTGDGFGVRVGMTLGGAVGRTVGGGVGLGVGLRRRRRRWRWRRGRGRRRGRGGVGVGDGVGVASLDGAGVSIGSRSGWPLPLPGAIPSTRQRERRRRAACQASRPARRENHQHADEQQCGRAVAPVQVALRDVSRDLSPRRRRRASVLGDPSRPPRSKISSGHWSEFGADSGRTPRSVRSGSTADWRSASGVAERFAAKHR